MNKKTSNAMRAAQQPTPEQLAAEKARVLRQKLVAIAEGIYIQLAGTTFKNWETGKRAVLDYFAMDIPTQAEATLVPNCSWQDSDHLPVMITI